MYKRIFHIVLFLVPLFSKGQSDYAPHLQRACLDRVSGELTLLFSPGKDSCNSFKKYRLWGRTDTFSSFELLDEATTFNPLSWKTLLPNKKRWQLYVSAYYSCTPGDSFLSNFLYIDNVPPSYVEPDSVSIDMSNQNLIAGWSNPPETDIMGYSMFRVDALGNNVLIDEQNVLFYSFLNSDFPSKQSGNRLAIAAYDSCRNGGVISNFHSPVLLQVNTNPNYLCDKGLQLNWTPYIGWEVDEYEIFIRDADRGVLLHQSRVVSTVNSFAYILPYLDVRLDVYVRAHKNGALISSTSNRVDLFVSDFPKPSKRTSLYFASVSETHKIDLEGFVNVGDSFDVFYKSNTSNWLLMHSTSSSGGKFQLTHGLNDTRIGSVSFLLIRYNECGQAADSSLIIKSIHLTGSDRDLQWNDNFQWEALGDNPLYIIEKEVSGNWISIGNTSNKTFTLPPYGRYQVRIKGESTLWAAEGRGYSYSNPISVDLGFDSSLLDTFLIPNAFTPEGINPIFKISNPAVSLGESQMQIFNRWGAIIFQGDALIGWDGTVNGNSVPDNIYIYRIKALYRSKRIEKAGTVLILR